VRRVILGVVSLLLLSGCSSSALSAAAPECPVGPEELSEELVIEAQSVPTATYLPCVSALPAGWRFGGLDARDGISTLTMFYDPVESSSVEVRLTRSCDVSGATEVPSEQPGVRTFNRVSSGGAVLEGRSHRTFEGGCITYSYSFSGPDPSVILGQLESSVALWKREQIDERLAEEGFHIVG
jgi:hypothetical protein